MKNECQADTLQSTALMHEVYLRLVDVSNVEWRERAQCYPMAAQMMRRILVDAARARGSQKRGGAARRVNLDDTAVLSPTPDRAILALDEALTAEDTRLLRPVALLGRRVRAVADCGDRTMDRRHVDDGRHVRNRRRMTGLRPRDGRRSGAS